MSPTPLSAHAFVAKWRAAYGRPADLADEELLARLLALNLARAEQAASHASPAPRA